MQQAFVVRNVRAIAGKTVILVDDIYTTGNTVKSAAATCKRAGADAVHVFTLAKG
jgi:predicted amidophosphoribosyltransferase